MPPRAFLRLTSDHPGLHLPPFLTFLSTRLAISILSILGTLLYTYLSQSTKLNPVLSHDLTHLTASPRGYHGGEKLLVLTPLKDASPYLEEYFYNLAQLNYPKHLISLAFLVSDTKDDTWDQLHKISRRINHRSKSRKERYERITILRQDFHFDLSGETRHGFEGQPVRRAFIARARNYLLTAVLDERASWVLWLDVDVIRYGPDTVMDLMSIDKDIVVPNTLWYQDSWQFWVSVHFMSHFRSR